MFCPNCGKETIEGARFCSNCGAGLSRASDGQTVAPTAVRPDLKSATDRQYAGFWRRLAAYIIDHILLGLVGWFLIVAGMSGFGGISAISIFAFIPMIFSWYLVRWLYFSLMENSVTQATLGKMALGIIVTDNSYNRISFGRATGRFFAKLISQYTIYIGYIIIAFTKKKQGLHDMIASTLVIIK